MDKPAYEEYDRTLRFILDRADDEIKQTQYEQEAIDKENRLPAVETCTFLLTTAIGFYAAVSFQDFMIFWLIASLILNVLLLLQSILSTKRIQNRRRLSAVRDNTTALDKMKIIDADEKGKILFYSVWEDIIRNVKPRAISFSLIFLVNIIFCVILLGSENGNSSSIFYKVAAISAMIFTLYGLMWFFQKSLSEFSTMLLQSHKVVETFKKPDPKSKVIFVLGVVDFLMLVVIVYMLPIWTLISMLLLLKENVFQSLILVSVTLVGQYIIFTFLHGLLSKRYILEWFDKKIGLLRNGVILPIESILSKGSPSNLGDVETIEKNIANIRKNFLKSKMFINGKIDLYGYFTRHFLMTNYAAFQEDSDIEILFEYLEHQKASIT